MNKQDLLKILDHLNKNFAIGKIKINKIVFYKNFEIKRKNPDKGIIHGYYDIKNKVIGIRKGISQLDQLETLLHEYAHAYERQFLKIKKRGHSKEGGRIFTMFKEESDKFLKISVKI